VAVEPFHGTLLPGIDMIGHLFIRRTAGKKIDRFRVLVTVIGFPKENDLVLFLEKNIHEKIYSGKNG
jgi:hypothetical protein